tara:strand:+ start:194 stop:496 length:303 start_codon:yes stop_codon:yes gene_type:complete
MITQTTLQDFISCPALISNFSYDGACALFEFFEDLESDIGDDIIFDPIDIRCNFSEYASILDAVNEYVPSDGFTEIRAAEWLQDRTIVIPFHGGVIIQNF